MQIVVVRSLKLTLFSLIVSLSSLSFADKIDVLKPTPEQSKAAIDLVQKLDSEHYRDQEFNDALSSRYFDEYLKSLDSAKNFFIQSDIAEFEKYRKTFDDDYKKGKLDNSFAIFNRFNERMIARLEKVVKTLDDPKTKFDFDVEESIVLDREKAPWPANEAEADKLWQQYLKSNLLNSMLSGKKLEESKTTLRKRYANQLRRLKQQTNEEAFSVMMNSLTMLYDPHTNYLSPENAENFDISMSLELQGIGAVLQSDEDYTKVSSLVVGGPAQKQGQLKPNDKIVSIAQGVDGEFVDVVGWRLDEVVKLIRGPKGTIVRLEVRPSDPTATINKNITIKRETVKLEDQAAKKAVFEVKNGNKTFKLGVIDIPTFYMNFEAYQKGDPNYKSTTRDVFNLLNELNKEKVDGIIIDLRDNGGGSLPEAAMLTDLFVDPGPVVQIRQSDDTISRNYRAYQPAVYRAPIAVLINRLSASASEIFAGAIQDYGRGIIIGSTTFGKGSVQNLVELKHGRLKITEAKFYRISGDSTQHRGVIPDVQLPSLLDPDDIGESSYDNALPWDRIHPAPHQNYYTISKFLPKIETSHQERMAQDPDFIFLNKQSAMFKEAAEKKEVSLRLATRQAEQQQMEKRALDMENQKRIAKGEKPYADYAALKKANGGDEDEDAPPKEADKEIIPKDDPYLMEAGHVLADFINQLTPEKKVAKQ
ncbi:carboxy terminal-processing peptidase [Cellvibrio fibrivorans]|uniref:Carboxyl-terminal processing protease n=1 Tax=Cellvibrio fibrivorans TaxID=126350 RepID=A0ABU1UX48_9GAMM|nr:carboxy terminal-processing peptidase [Cellvibrio fibrivorans]MDR7089740.1 carboxyl-terminal processing protease [Cellvibrio fibrivorans]